MKQTVVGVFDLYAQAQHAAQQLRDSGFGDSVYVTEELSDEQSLRTRDASASPGTRDEGVMASIRNFFSDLFTDDDNEVGTYADAVSRGGAVVKVQVDEGARADEVRATLEAAGAVDLDQSVDMFDDESSSAAPLAARTSGAGSTASLQGTSRTAGASSEQVIPVVQEELQVGKRTVSTGRVRVYAHTVETPVNESVQLRTEQADIERTPVNRPASDADLQALGERTIEVRETTETPMVMKDARVVEEVRVGKNVTERTEQVNDTLRSTQVEIEKLPGDDGGRGTGLASGDDSGYRSHFESTYGSEGGRYEEYEPAYRYGSGLRSEGRYTGRSWDEVEPELRTDWETRNPGGLWERTKAAVRHGWERTTK